MAKEERQKEITKIVVKKTVPIRTFEKDQWKNFTPPDEKPVECHVCIWYLLPEMKEKLFSIAFDFKAFGLSLEEWLFAEKAGLVELIFKQEVLEKSGENVFAC